MSLFLNQNLVNFRKQKGLSQKEVGELIGKSQQTIGHYEKGIREPSFRDIQLLCQALDCSPADLMGLNDRMRVASEPAQPQEYPGEQSSVELPVVTVAARPNFVTLNESAKNYGLSETVSLLVNGPNRDYAGQIIVEINGDSMEPRLCMGDRVRCRYVSPDNWPFLPAGVYAVAFSSYFVVKRVKTNELQSRQILALHSDNALTGGSLDVPRDQLHHLWQVVELVSGWVR